jgi:cardiolipin synthase
VQIQTVFIVLAYVLAVPCVAAAILRSRTPQGAVAWTVGLLSFPFVAVPLYLIFGRSKFNGYRIKRRLLDRRAREELSKTERISRHECQVDERLKSLVSAVTASKQVAFTGGNKIALLVDAEKAYRVMLDELKTATEYILFQFYIFRCDETGRLFLEVLKEKARAGVAVHFLYDEIGSKIPKKIQRELREAGVRVGQFNTTKGPKNRFQINFRNHRKIVLVDGRVAVVGGMNIGEEHLGRNKKMGKWRDTQARVEGCAVMAVQTAFAKDWFWSQGKLLQARWEPIRPEGGTAEVMALHTGPVDDLRTCLQSHVALINAATKRLWIATPYLVLPDSLSDALSLAALRGVDVRILVPSRNDNMTVKLASQVYEAELTAVGAKIFRYSPGFLHQKVMLVDDLVGVVGSANLDYRSMFLNFELSLISTDKTWTEDLARMFEKDFSVSRPVSPREFEKRPLARRFLERAADLFAPIL